MILHQSLGWMGQQGENHQGQISNTKYKNRGTGEEERQECGVFIGHRRTITGQ